MANLLQSSQVQQTTAPSYYTDYLKNLICRGQAAQQGAQYVGATPLQQQAFTSAAQNQGQYTPLFQTAQGLYGCAANQNVMGAATPYLQQAATSGGLSAAQPFICQAAQTNIQGAAQPFLSAAVACSPAQMAQQYMSPYLQTAVQSLSDIAQRNIQQNIAPQATAAAVGSGQFGSQRGAQVLGQLEANAMQCLNSQIAQMEQAGYGQALCAAKGRSALLGQLGATAGCLAKAQGSLGLQAGQVAGCLAQRQAGLFGQLGSTAGCLTARQAAARTQAAQGLGALGCSVARTNIACLNALATLGEQCRVLQQNRQLFPLQTLQDLSSVMQGAQIPMGTTMQMQGSPLSAIGGTLGLLAGAGQNYGNIAKSLSGIGKLFGFGSCPSVNNIASPNEQNNMFSNISAGLPSANDLFNQSSGESIIGSSPDYNSQFNDQLAQYFENLAPPTG